MLGTGFFVGKGDALHVITAKHVIEDNPLAEGEQYALVFGGEKGIAVVGFGSMRLAQDYDVAALMVSRASFPEAESAPPVALALMRADPALNAEVLTYEYSSTRIECKPLGGMHVSFEPYAHKGNIVRSYTSTFPEKTPTRSVLTSFPALQGASGAPILTGTASKNSFAVVGMTVANFERTLLPAQILELHTSDGKVESKTSYYLPLGKAIARSVLATCLEGMQIPFEYAEDVEPHATSSDAQPSPVGAMTPEAISQQKGIQFYSAAVQAWINTSLELDKSLLALSGGGIGLLVTLLSTVGVSKDWLVGLYVAAMLALLCCIAAVLKVFLKNKPHIERVLKDEHGRDPVLDRWDSFARWSFAGGAVLTTIIGISTAWLSFSTKEAQVANERLTREGTVDFGKSLSGIGSLKPNIGGSAPAQPSTQGSAPAVPTQQPTTGSAPKK